jgi:hypothetical protein
LAPPPVLENPRPAEERSVVVLVPGATGTTLVEGSTGRMAWGLGANLLRPRDGGYELALPLQPLQGAPSALEAGEVIRVVRLAGLIRKPIYQPIVDLLEASGYRLGDLDAPAAEDDLYLFAYDWRRDNIETARQLADQLERAARAREGGEMEVALVCQSNGAHICRWLAKYGRAGLEQAEAGMSLPPHGVKVTRIVLVGSSNGGSLRILRELHRGRRYLALVGRFLAPEVLFSFRSLFQDLPVYREDLFLDQEGRPLDVDLFEAESWERYGWSVFSKKSRRRLERRGRDDLFGDEAIRRVYLQSMLDRAVRFHRMLATDPVGSGKVVYYLIQNGRLETPARALLVKQGGRWRTLFTGDPELERDPRLQSPATGRGDGHATVESQLFLSPREMEGFGAEPVHVEGDHFELILNPVAKQRLLDFLR